MLEAVGRCARCAARYRIERGVGVLLTEGAPDDLWERAESHLGRTLRKQPALERALLGGDGLDLAPADVFYRGLALEERGEAEAAREAFARADAGLYTAETRACRDRALDTVVAQVVGAEGPIVDLASGRCTLVEHLTRSVDRPIVATDVSPQVLLRSGEALSHQGLASRVSLLALDARRTPFRDGAVETMTTYAGLSNIDDPGTLLRELRRIVGGSFLAVATFYRPDDGANAEAIRGLGLERLLYRDALLEELDRAGWSTKIVHSSHGVARPTPTGRLLSGAGIDVLPVAETELEWAVLEAR